MFTDKKRNSASVPNADAPDRIVYFINEQSLLCAKDANGNVVTLGGVSRILLNNDPTPLDGVVQLDGIFNGSGQLTAQPIPAAADSGRARLFARRIAGRIMPAWIGPSGLDTMVQPNIARNFIARIRPTAPGLATLASEGFNNVTTVGTATARTPASTNLLTRQTRLGLVSGTTAGSIAALYAASNPNFSMGKTNQGGFWYVNRFAITDPILQPAARMFVGLSSNVAAPTNVALTTLTNSIGLGRETTDTNLGIFYGGASALTRIDCGANFNHSNLLNVPLEFAMFSSPTSNGAELHWRLERLDTGVFTEGTITGTEGAQLPSFATLLAPRMFRITTAGPAVALDFASLYIESDI